MAMGQGSRSKKHRHSGIVLAEILMNVTEYTIGMYSVSLLANYAWLCGVSQWRWNRVRVV
jgi:hypothetical protein